MAVACFWLRDMRLAGRLTGWAWKRLPSPASSVFFLVRQPFCCGSPRHERTIAASSVREFSAAGRGWASDGFLASCLRRLRGRRGPWARRPTIRAEHSHRAARDLLCSGLFFYVRAYCEIVGFPAWGFKELAIRSAAQRSGACAMHRRVWPSRWILAASISLLLRLLAPWRQWPSALCIGPAAALRPRGQVHEVHAPGAAVSMSAFLGSCRFVLACTVRRAGKLLQLREHHRGAGVDLVYISVVAAKPSSMRERRRSGRRSACWGGIAAVVSVKNVYPVPDFPTISVASTSHLAWWSACLVSMKLLAGLVIAM